MSGGEPLGGDARNFGGAHREEPVLGATSLNPIKPTSASDAKSMGRGHHAHLLGQRHTNPLAWAHKHPCMFTMESLDSGTRKLL